MKIVSLIRHQSYIHFICFSIHTKVMIPGTTMTQAHTSAIAWSFSSWLCSCYSMWASSSSLSSCTASTVESAFKWQRTRDPRPISAWSSASWNSMTRSRLLVARLRLHPIRNKLCRPIAERSNQQTRHWFPPIPCHATTLACTIATANSWSRTRKGLGIASSSKTADRVLSGIHSVYLVQAFAHRATRTLTVWWLIWATSRTAWTTLIPRRTGARRVTCGKRQWRSTRSSWAAPCTMTKVFPSLSFGKLSKRRATRIRWAQSKRMRRSPSVQTTWGLLAMMILTAFQGLSHLPPTTFTLLTLICRSRQSFSQWWRKLKWYRVASSCQNLVND